MTFTYWWIPNLIRFQPGVRETFKRAKLKDLRYAESVDQAVAIIRGMIFFNSNSSCRSIWDLIEVGSVV